MTPVVTVSPVGETTVVSFTPMQEILNLSTLNAVIFISGEYSSSFLQETKAIPAKRRKNRMLLPEVEKNFFVILVCAILVGIVSRRICIIQA